MSELTAGVHNSKGYPIWALNADQIDDVSLAVKTIPFDHHEVHEGNAFTCHYNNDVTNIGEMTVIAFNTPDTTTLVHMVAEFQSTGASYAAIYESPSLDVDEGTDLTIYNRNRNSATTSTVSTIETTPEAGKATSYDETQAAGANLTTTVELARFYIGSAGTGVVGGSGGGARGVAEFILKQNTQYAFVLSALTADDTTHNIKLEWYEHVSGA